MSKPSFRSVGSASLACAVLGVSFVALQRGGVPGLAAASNINRTDQDGDGLSDQQELVLGTLPFRRDSDRDSYTDFEEIARGSGAMDPGSVPEGGQLGLGSCASQENGFVKMLTTVFVESMPLDSLWLGFGLIYQGQVFYLTPQDLQYSSGFLRPAREAGETLAGLEVGIPERLVRRLGRVHLFAVLGSQEPGSERFVTTQSFHSVGNVVTSIQQRRIGLSSSGGSGTQGVVYRPLAGDDELTAGGWQAGKVCFQQAAAVGSTGASILYEIDGADCIPMDTQCNPSDCAAGVGTSLDLPDPGGLIGG